MKAHELIAKPDNWCQNDYAQTEHKVSINYKNPTACRWCMVGAVLKCYAADEYRRIRRRINEMLVKYGWHLGALRYNDSMTHGDVVKILREAEDEG